MPQSDAARISARAELALLGDPGCACLVVQRRPCESWYRVAACCRSHVAGRRWIEAHYEEVRWRSPVACTALVGKMRTAPQLSPEPDFDGRVAGRIRNRGA